MQRNHNLVSCRVTFPLVPSAVRVATSMLSATMEHGEGRLVAHSVSTADVQLSASAHNAPLYVALTRVQNMEDLAITTDTKLHANMLKPRQPLKHLLKDVRVYGNFVKVYHCKTAPHSAADHLDRGGVAHDGGLQAQLDAGMFVAHAQQVADIQAAMPQQEECDT